MSLKSVSSTCSGSTYSYGSSNCASCVSGATFISATEGCKPSPTLTSGPSDTKFYLSGSLSEGILAFPTINEASKISYTKNVFGTIDGSLSLSSGSSCSVTPAIGSSLLDALPTGNEEWSASLWVKCDKSAFSSIQTYISWGSIFLGTGKTGFSFTTSTSWKVVTLAEQTSYANGPNIAVDGAGNVFVAETDKIRKITPAGVSSVFAPGTFGRGLAADKEGNVYVADTDSNCIRKITKDGIVSTLAGNGCYDTTDGSAACFKSPRGVAVDSSGFVYVADTDNIRIRKITPQGYTSTLATNIIAFGIAVDSNGNIYLSSQGGSISKLFPGGGSEAFAGFGSHGIAVDSDGNVYTADGPTVRVISPTGSIRTVAGSNSGYIDDVGTAAKFSGPSAVAVDPIGNIYVSDNGNGRIRKIFTNSELSKECDSTWHHLSVTHGEGSPSATKVYVDGLLSSISSKTFVIPSDGTSSLNIGWNGATSGNNQPFSGFLSDIRIYGRALSSTEVLALAQPPLSAIANIITFPPAPVYGTTSILFSCAAGSAGISGFLLKSLVDNSWSWSSTVPSCAPCTPGYWSPQGSAFCTPCPPGTFSLAGSSKCSLCPAGTYGDRAGLQTDACSGTCTSCAAGSSVSMSSPIACTAMSRNSIPSDVGLLFVPAAMTGNRAHVDVIAATESMCNTMASIKQGGATCDKNVDTFINRGATYYVIGTAEAMNMEPAETLTCAKV